MELKTIFTEEERFFINDALKNERLHNLSKEDILKKLAFVREAAPEDALVIEMVEEVYSKIKELSDDEWGQLKDSYPFATNIDNNEETEKIV